MANEDVGGGASRSTDPAAGSSAATDVSLREYLTEKITRTDEKVSANRKQSGERFVFVGMLGGVVWFFIERHLSQLNNSHARLDKAVALNVSADTYNANEQQRDKESSELTDWRKDVDKFLTQGVTRSELQQETRTESRDSGRYVWQIVAAIAGLVALAVLLATTYAATRSDTPASTPAVVCTAAYHPQPCP